MHERADGGARAAKFPRWSAYCVTRNVTRGVSSTRERWQDDERPKGRVVVFEMSRRLSRYKRGRRAVDLSASRFDGERQKTAPPPARQPSLLFTAVRLRFFPFLPSSLCVPLFTSLSPIARHRAARYHVLRPILAPYSWFAFAQLCCVLLRGRDGWKGILSLSLLKRVLIPRS